MELALDLDKAYYAAIAFVMVLFAGWLITKLVVILQTVCVTNAYVFRWL